MQLPYSPGHCSLIDAYAVMCGDDTIRWLRDALCSLDQSAIDVAALDYARQLRVAASSGVRPTAKHCIGVQYLSRIGLTSVDSSTRIRSLAPTYST
eukprot:COSAG02_NODE_3948_length_6001_cov_23.394844_5_plen_96_part_00